MAQETELKAGFFQDDGRGTDARTGVVLLPLGGRNGFIFALTRLDKKYGNELRQITAAIEQESRAVAEDSGPKSNPQHLFETYLANLNARLDDERRKGFWDMRARELNAVVGLADEDEMYLSGTGDLAMLFLHRVTPEQYKVFNLTNNIKAENAVPVWHKIFAVVLDGNLAEGDVFCAVSRELKAAIDGDELNEILTTLPPTSAAAKIRQHFAPEAAVAAIVLQRRAPGENDEIDRRGPGADLSLKELGAAEARTAALLEDQKPSGFLSKLAGLPAATANLARQAKPRAIAWLKETGKGAGKKLLIGLGQRWLRGKFKLFRRNAERSEERREHERELENQKERRERRKIPALYIALAALGILGALSASIYFLNQAQARNAERQAYDEVIKRIEDRLEQGAAALIYKDEDRSGRFYAEAETALTDLPTDTPERQATAERYRNQIAMARDTLRHIASIPNPPLIAAYPEGTTGATLVANQGKFFLFGRDKKVYELDMVGKTLKAVATTDGAVGVALAAAGSDKQVYFLDDRPGISLFNPTTKQLQVSKLAPAAGAAWRDIIYYSDRLYVLATEAEGQVWRYAPSGTDFSAGNAWIKSKSVSFDDAVSFSIDGTIFVLKSNGQIVRFASGSEVSWTYETAEPAVTAAKKIWTDADSAFVYVLDGATPRIVVYHKDSGQIAVQYRLPALTINSFLVDEKNRTLLILGNDGIYSLSANHLP